jgi:hypothetical protein
MMKAANTAGTLMNRKNWSTESIAIPPRYPAKDEATSPAALLHPLRDVLIGGHEPIGNGGTAHREQRQNRNHGQKFHGKSIDPDYGQKRQRLARFRDDPEKYHDHPRSLNFASEIRMLAPPRASRRPRIGLTIVAEPGLFARTREE